MGSFLQKLLTNPEDFKFYTDNQKGAVNPNNQNPRTIPFGRDRFNDKLGEGSNQPYGWNKKSSDVGIGDMLEDFAESYEATIGKANIGDFIIRGGVLAPLRALRDSIRLTRFFSDIKNPKGILFLTKQNLLSRIGTKTEASEGLGYAGGALNEGAYTPLSTIEQALVGFAGGHLKKQGLAPLASINKYQDVIAKKSKEFEKKQHIVSRLTNLTYLIVNPPKTPFTSYGGIKNYSTYPNEFTLIEYGGGPGSKLGFGSTKIKFATKNDGAKLTVFGEKLNENLKNTDLTSTGARYKTWNYNLITTQSINYNAEIKEDFKSFITSSKDSTTFLMSSPSYLDKNKKNIETRLNLNNPGSPRKNRSSYTSGSDGGNSLDKLNASYIYQSSTDKPYNSQESYSDIIPFIISILNNDGTTNRKNMHFRAFIDSFSDSYDADWSPIEYMGRAEKLYKYKGFGRKISIAFTVVAQSREEITAMYDKLNFLASSLAPEYLDSETSGYMAGNIAYITLGEYIYDQPGIITSLTFDIPEESPWEIGINDEGIIKDTEERKKDIRQVPHMIKVTGFNFIPIHKFRPEKQTWSQTPGTNSTELKVPGGQHYIDPLRPKSTNYDQKPKTPKPKTPIITVGNVESREIVP
jgi:hypothetical protein